MKKVLKKVLKKVVTQCFIEEVIDVFYFASSFFRPALFDKKSTDKLKNTKKIVYLMTPTHSNIGDSAIAEGAYAFFQKEFPEYFVVEFTDIEVQKNRRYIKSIITNNDIVFFHGGGNLGDWYPTWEIIRQNSMRYFNFEKMVLMPQTISFGNNPQSERLLRRSKSFYSKNKIAYFFCRDRKSYQYAKSVLGAKKIYLAPDSALCSDRKEQIKKEEKKILLCLRQDIEKITKDSDIVNVCKNKGYPIVFTDTMASAPIDQNSRSSIVNEKIREFQEAGVVITDRYHGVIFSYLAQVPCIALANKDSKVEEAMYFFEQLPYIKFASSITEIEHILDEIKDLDTSVSIDFYSQYFKGVIK